MRILTSFFIPNSFDLFSDSELLDFAIVFDQRKFSNSGKIIFIFKMNLYRIWFDFHRSLKEIFKLAMSFLNINVIH